jgi:nicotinamidase/pyrazinamidase
LAVAGGKKTAEAVADFLRERRADYALVVTTQDWHDADDTNGGHFAAPGTEPDFVNTWPVHCVAGTHGADFSPAMRAALPLVDAHIHKGQGSPGYSGFSGTTDDGRTLPELLASHGIDDLDVVGIAMGFCVRATAIDATRLTDARVTVFLDLCRELDAAMAFERVKQLLDAGVEVRYARPHPARR